jgi:superoxide dismutase, Fe-Mn family
LVMDVWEHAYLLNYKPSERQKYIEAFYSNIDWNVVHKRLRQNQKAVPEGRDSFLH